MAGKTDYLNDPNAPAPNSIKPAANVAVLNDAAELLLIRRADNGNYALPGGAMDFGESLTETAIRECREETGYEIEIDGLVGVFTNPGHVVHYNSNNEVRQEFAVVYHGHLTGGAAKHNDEATEIIWVPLPQAADLEPMHDSMRYRIAVFAKGELPHLDRPHDISGFLRARSED